MLSRLGRGARAPLHPPSDRSPILLLLNRSTPTHAAWLESSTQGTALVTPSLAHAPLPTRDYSSASPLNQQASSMNPHRPAGWTSAGLVNAESETSAAMVALKPCRAHTAWTSAACGSEGRAGGWMGRPFGKTRPAGQLQEDSFAVHSFSSFLPSFTNRPFSAPLASLTSASARTRRHLPLFSFPVPHGLDILSFVQVTPAPCASSKCSSWSARRARLSPPPPPQPTLGRSALAPSSSRRGTPSSGAARRVCARRPTSTTSTATTASRRAR